MQLERHKICSKFCFICSDISLQNQRLIVFWCWTFETKRLLSLYEVWAAARFNISEGCCPARCQCLQTAELVKTSWTPDTELLQGFLCTAWSAIYSALPMRSDREETGEIWMRLERVLLWRLVWQESLKWNYNRIINFWTLCSTFGRRCFSVVCRSPNRNLHKWLQFQKLLNLSRHQLKYLTLRYNAESLSSGVTHHNIS